MISVGRALARVMPIYLGALSLALGCGSGDPARGDEGVRLQERFPAGYLYHVNTRVDLSGTLSLPPEKNQASPRTLNVTGTSAIEYDERVLAVAGDGQVKKTARIYRRVDLDRKVADRAQQNTIRPAVRRLVVLRLKNLEVPFSLDGPLTWGEIDLVRTDVFTPALAGMLPDKPVQPGDRWTAATLAIQELTDMERIEGGEITCRLEQLTAFGDRRLARVAFAGTVRGVNEDGPNRQKLEGYFFFDLESHHLSYLYLKGVSDLLDKEGKALGSIEGRFVLTRQANQHARDLTDEALRGLTLEPNADNTLLLYDNPDLGIRFLYPRRWRVAGVHGRQVALDEAAGSGMLLTLDPPASVPSGAQFLAETRAWLSRQKAAVLRVGQPRHIQGAPRDVEHFDLEAELGGQRVVMDYFVLRQAVAGATVAARLLPADLANLQRETERIARSITLTRPISLQPMK